MDQTTHDAHVTAYYEEQEAISWSMACAQMKRAEGDWEDRGCRPDVY